MIGTGRHPRPRLSLTGVRYALASDLALLGEIEAEADATFAGFGDISGWPPPPSGEQRAEGGGVLLVAGQPAMGFAHLVDLGASERPHWHLEQIAVRPAASRAGIGRMLLRAAMGAVLDRGQDELTLMTFADVAWNAPWYAREGFAPLTPDADPQLWDRLAALRAAEQSLGLERLGRRVAMVTRLTDDPPPRRAVSVIPVRQGPGRLEVFVQHRALTMDFAPGAVVFPGGRVDPVDQRVADELGLDVAQACAVREVAEEAGAVVEPDRLIPWDRWITPIRYPKRFDVEFFLLPVIGGEDFVHRTEEATHSLWTSVPELVSAVESGEVSMVPPTRTIVDELSALGSLDRLVRLRPEVRPVRHDLTPLRPRARRAR